MSGGFSGKLEAIWEPRKATPISAVLLYYELSDRCDFAFGHDL